MPRARIEELGDRLVVHFRPRWSRDVPFLTLWLLLWSVGGIAAIGAMGEAGAGERAFLLVWLCGWAAGEVVVGGWIAWLLLGRESLTVTPQQLELRRKLGRFERVKTYDADGVHAVAAGRVPTSEDEPDRRDFCLLLWHGEERVAIGSGLEEAEAELVASTVVARMRPLGRWGEVPLNESQPESKGGAAAGLIVLVVLVVGVGVASKFLDEKHEPSRQTHLGEFSDPADYAAAQTRWVLQTSEPPKCDERATWTHWTCRVKARAEAGSFAGQMVTYRCSPTQTNLDGSRFRHPTVMCRPDESALRQNAVPQMRDGR